MDPRSAVKDSGHSGACLYVQEAVDAVVGQSLESLFRDRGPQLWRAVLLATGNREIASDAVAEAFAQALRRGHELRNPMSWIWRVAFRVAAGELKARNETDALPADVGYDAPDSLVDLARSLGRLTYHQRSALVLAEYAGYSHREIARVLGSSVAAVGVHVHRARARMRAMMGEDDE